MFETLVPGLLPTVSNNSSGPKNLFSQLNILLKKRTLCITLKKNVTKKIKIKYTHKNKVKKGISSPKKTLSHAKNKNGKLTVTMINQLHQKNQTGNTKK